jgi:hypothetical protein
MRNAPALKNISTTVWADCFNSNGRILVRSLSKDEISAYGLTGDEKIVVTDKKRIYLQWHHENKFLATAK